MTSGGNTSSGTYGGNPGSRISGGVVTLGLLGSKNCLKWFKHVWIDAARLQLHKQALASNFTRILILRTNYILRFVYQ